MRKFRLLYGANVRYGVYTCEKMLSLTEEAPKERFETLFELKGYLESKGYVELDRTLDLIEQIPNKEMLILFAEDNELNIDKRFGVDKLRTQIKELMEAKDVEEDQEEL